MQRIYSTFIEMTAAGVFMIPVFCIYGKCIFHSIKRTMMYLIFGLYLAAVLALIGFPSVTYIRFDVVINVIPFVGMASDFHNACLNVLLFVPLGIFLPLLWDEYRDIKSILIFSLLMTAGIEFSQIFTYRATDLNDVITNVLGALIGYCLIKAITNKFTRYVNQESCVKELYLVCGTVVIIMFFMQPFVSALLWERILA